MVKGSSILFDLLCEMLFDFTHIIGLQSERFTNFLNLFYNTSKIFYLFDPLVDMRLVSIYVSFNHCYIIDYLLRLFRHDCNLFD